MQKLIDFFRRLITPKPNVPREGFIATVIESPSLSYSINKNGMVAYHDGFSEDVVFLGMLAEHRIDALGEQFRRREIHEGNDWKIGA